MREWVLFVAIFGISSVSLVAIGVVLWAALLIAFVLAALGVVVIALPLGGGGSWLD